MHVGLQPEETIENPLSYLSFVHEVIDATNTGYSPQIQVLKMDILGKRYVGRKQTRKIRAKGNQFNC